MDCGAARILRSVLWDSWYADAHFFFDEPDRFDLCSGLQRGRQRFFLGQDFGFCCKEARLVSTKLPDRSLAGGHPRDNIVLGRWSNHRNHERTAARRPVDRIALYQICLPELQFFWTFRARNPGHAVS